MKTYGLRAFAATAVTAMMLMLALVHAGPLQEVDVRQAQQMKSQGALLLDVRETDEYANGHAPGSVLIPVGQLEQRLKEIEGYRNQPVAVICRSGRRSAVATQILQKAGFSAARNVGGGMNAWEKAGLPVITSVK